MCYATIQLRTVSPLPLPFQRPSANCLASFTDIRRKLAGWFLLVRCATDFVGIYWVYGFAGLKAPNSLHFGSSKLPVPRMHRWAWLGSLTACVVSVALRLTTDQASLAASAPIQDQWIIAAAGPGPSRSMEHVNLQNIQMKMKLYKIVTVSFWCRMMYLLTIIQVQVNFLKRPSCSLPLQAWGWIGGPAMHQEVGCFRLKWKPSATIFNMKIFSSFKSNSNVYRITNRWHLHCAK